jgi:D-inositol-3-phosphate glycosyltransferase
MTASQLRIAMLSVHSCPVGNLGAKDTGGMSVYVREVARELGKQGISVDVYTRVHDLRDPQFVELGERTRLVHLAAGESEGIHRLAIYPYLPAFAENLENFRQQENLQYDLIFSHYWLSGVVGRSLEEWWGVPHIMMFHTMGAVKNAIGAGEEEPELRLENERQLARTCHRVIAATEREKEALTRHYGALPERISVIPCGVNLEQFQPMDKESARRELGFDGERIILFVGRIEPLKGVDQLLRAVAYLKDIEGMRLVIIGGDEQSQNEIEGLQRLSRELDIEDSVTFLGLVSHDKLLSFYSAADVCVLPSYYESFGLVALESIACGTPVVATDVGDLRSIIRQGETGYVVTNNSPRSLAPKLRQLLSVPGSDMKAALSIRKSVVGFGWGNIARSIIEECRLVLAELLILR